MAHVGLKGPSKTKVGNLGIEILVKEDITNFDISMDDSNLTSTMEMCQPLSCADNDVEPLLPIQRLNLILVYSEKQNKTYLSVSPYGRCYKLVLIG